MIEEVAKNARLASLELASLTTDAKNAALAAVRDSLLAHKEDIEGANRADKEAAQMLMGEGKMGGALFKRLNIEGEKFDGVISGIDDVVKLDDPIGQVTRATRLDEGLDLIRVTCPIGVICVIFEARPDAAVQISSLAIKSANAIILKGGTEAVNSNKALVAAIREGLGKATGKGGAAFPVNAVQLVSSREDIAQLLGFDHYIDLVIPRGSNEMVKHIQGASRIPVLGHADGICSVLLHTQADPVKAARVVVDSKTQYTAVCNAAETLLVMRGALPLLPAVAAALLSKGVALVADELAREAIGADKCTAAVESDFRTEWLDLKMSVKTVDSLDDAIAHINSHGSHHTDCIITENKAAAERFMAQVDSAGVYHNASTRFADGFRYGFGAEVGVATTKTHSRGPVGMEGLTIYKYKMYGTGQIVADFGSGGKDYLHKDLLATSRPTKVQRIA
jgi:glutamate-5-semialdehyde dehydrogenase